METQRDKWVKLAQLANFLDDLPHDKFHMPKWASPDFSENSCGTAGCACGWAATIWKNEWKLVPMPGRPGEAWPALRATGLRASAAFAEFFGVPVDDAFSITCALDEVGSFGFGAYTTEYGLRRSCDITPRHAADRIRKVLAKYDPSVLEERGKPAPALVTT